MRITLLAYNDSVLSSYSLRLCSCKLLFGVIEGSAAQPFFKVDLRERARLYRT
jgi:hypothetical protein